MLDRQPASLVGPSPPTFCFVVHALSRLHRGIMGVPSMRVGLIGQWNDGTSVDDVLPVCRLRLGDRIAGAVVGVPMTPTDLLSDQQRAVDHMVEAVALAGPVAAVGLGSLCAVVGGRGEALAGRLDVPVTNGGAATAWALLANVRTVLAQRGERRVAIIGSRSPIGLAVAQALADDGIHVRVDHRRAAKSGNVEACSGPVEVVKGCQVIVGCGPTGGVLPAAALSPGAVVVDVAIPGTVIGKPHKSIVQLAGEAVALPADWHRGFWGWLYHVLSGYGPSQVFACLIEPLVLAASGRDRPYSIGRTLSPADVAESGQQAEALGFAPRLAQGWSAFPPERLMLQG